MNYYYPYTDQYWVYPGWVEPTPQPCPTCGRCPTCGKQTKPVEYINDYRIGDFPPYDRITC